MLNLRSVPLKYRLPIINAGLLNLSRLKSLHWPKAKDDDIIAPGPLIVSGFFAESSGIARGGQLSLKGFETAGYPVKAYDLRPCFRHFVDGKAQMPVTERGGVWYIHANAPEVLVALLAHSPDQWADRYRIGYFAWETPKAPANWVWTAQYLHEIWVPSQFVREAMLRAFEVEGRPDLSPRVRVMPHPMFDVDKAVAKRSDFGLTEGLTEFLCLFDAKSSSARKNPWAVIDAWVDAFPTSSTTARLTLKVQDLSRDPETGNRLGRYMAGRDDIRLFTERLSDEAMNDFMASFDALISLHRSEGFGLTLAEAMTLGVNVIATGWSGNVDFMDAECGHLIPYQLIPIKDATGTYEPFRPFWIKADPEQVWADPDITAASRAITKVASDSAIRQQTATAAKVAVSKLNATWDRDQLEAQPFSAYVTA